MSWEDTLIPWPGQPARCRCATHRRAVATIEETLDCPAGWEWMPGTGWVHAAQAARNANTCTRQRTRP